MLSLNIFTDIIKSMDETFNELEQFINNHFDNPILWIIIVVMLLCFIALAMNVLGGKR